MTETAQEYTKRILENVAGKDPLKTQAATPRSLGQIDKGRYLHPNCASVPRSVNGPSEKSSLIWPTPKSS